MVARDRDTRAELVQTMARLLRDQGFTATGRAQLLGESGVSNGSLYHHFPGGMEELAEAALEASGQAVADALNEALDGPRRSTRRRPVPRHGRRPGWRGSVPGLPGRTYGTRITHHQPTPTRGRGAVLRPMGRHHRRTASRRRMARGLVVETASAALALIEGALLLARVSGQASHLANAKRAAAYLLARPLAADGPGAGEGPCAFQLDRSLPASPAAKLVAVRLGQAFPPSR